MAFVSVSPVTHIRVSHEARSTSESLPVLAPCLATWWVTYLAPAISYGAHILIWYSSVTA
eukprot:51707-Eustigmatos_ZCMA.PRE.1